MEAADAACAVLAPPPQARPLYQFACEITLSGGGPLDGTKLNPPAERAIDLWLQEVSSRRHQWHVLIAPSQRGKTLCGVIIPILHALIDRRVNAGWVMPNLDKLGQKWVGDIQPTIESSGFGEYLPTKGPASKGGRPAALRINDPTTGRRMSTMYAMPLGKGGSESSTSSNPCAFLAIDEADDAESAGQLKLAMKRTAAFGAAGGGIVVSTINARQGRSLHPIIELYEDTTKTRMAHVCPHCNARVTLGIENFSHETASMSCPSCGVVWSESDRHAARNNGVYVHERPDAEVFGVRYVAVDYFWEYPDPATGKTTSVMQTLASEHKAALAAKDRGDQSPWNTYIRKQWCMEETDDGGDVPTTVDMALAARTTRSVYARGEIPPDAKVVTIGADTGKKEVWWLGLAMAPDMRWWIVDWSVKTTADARGEPTPDQQREMLDRMRDRAMRIGRADSMGIDVGYNTDLVVKWAQANGFRQMRGDCRPTGFKDDGPTTLPSWASERRQADGTRWLFIDGAIVKAEIHKSLARNPGEPGAGHLPRGQEAGDWLIRHLTCEVWDAKYSAWVKKHKDNHLLDCLVYAWAQAAIEVTKPPPPDNTIDIPLMHLGGLAL